MGDHPAPDGIPAAAYGKLTDEQGRILLTQPPGDTHAPWRLPGGLVEPGEAPSGALVREVREELALHLTVDQLLALEWVEPRTVGRRARLAFLFSVPTLTAQEVAGIVLQRKEIAALCWAGPHTALDMLHPRHAARLAAVWAADHPPVYLEHHTKENRDRDRLP